MPVPSFVRFLFQAKELKSQFTRPLFVKKKIEILAYTTSILFLKPPSLKNSVHKTPLSEADINLQTTHFGNMGYTPLPVKS